MLKINANPTIKINDSVQFNTNTNTNTSSNIPITIKDAPAYGNLKGGTNPTYRVWKKTLKNRNNITTPTNSLRTMNNHTIKNKPVLYTKKYTVGKRKNSNKVTVLLKDNKTRKKINNELYKLKQTPISEIKTYLKKQNLIKNSSIAPNDVLRKLYEDSYLTGNIVNDNADILLHNFNKID